MHHLNAQMEHSKINDHKQSKIQDADRLKNPQILLSNSKSQGTRIKSKSKRKQKDLIIKSKSKGASVNNGRHDKHRYHQ